MTHVVTQSCCNDASCVAVCPVNCIHPTPAEGGFATAEMLYIDPGVCIDCGACADICPVGAIVADYDLAEKDQVYLELNARFFDSAEAPSYVHRRADRDLSDLTSARSGDLRVAIVGSGPAGAFAAQYLLEAAGVSVSVDMYERLPVPWGLLRFGVAPDHPKTKEMAGVFERTADHPRFRLLLGIDVGNDVAIGDLADAYDAVVYATGALSDRKLGIPGEALPGSYSATEFAAWYNGHPDFCDRVFDLDCERAVVIGNGNVALDVARVLASDVAALRQTDIADHALDALARSCIREVLVVGRRGPAEAAFTTPELLGLAASRAFRAHAELPDDDAPQAPGAADPGGWVGSYKRDMVRQLASRPPSQARVLRLLFKKSPVELVGDTRVTGIRLVRNRLEPGPDGQVSAQPVPGSDELVETGLVLRSVGYKGAPIDGMPFDDRKGRIPNAHGRIVDPATDRPYPGAYVTGWIRRGPSGSMGSNRSCARETVAALLDDHRNGRLPRRRPMSAELASAIARSSGLEAWRAVDRHERDQGRASRRPRVKLVDRDDMIRIGNPDLVP